MADIELVIKLPQEKYNMIKRNMYCDINDVNVYKAIIKNGTPLPKGHGRLIDADKTISKICGNSCGCHLEECGYDEPCFSVRRIESAPTIIEADNGESEG